ncbi:hypothetical protein [Saccharothrix variisporea]|uniref:Uncharacterized protein n=1 Tax=Saccharothrix variisporea TaxID=543527 RepID=A0A495XHV3_9PSEU|nr:hypothetical protein [Saccharothrix variisporea]RKT73940.1 hypothetical protein DFJ66_7280 [Saccharothrix variisporea]
MLEDRLKELFDELNIKPTPRPSPVSAVDIVWHGRRIRNRRRRVAVVGTALTTTALVAAAGFALTRPSNDPTPATPPLHTSTPSPATSAPATPSPATPPPTQLPPTPITTQAPATTPPTRLPATPAPPAATPIPTPNVAPATSTR